MKKLFVAATLFLFLGATTASTYAMANGVNIEMNEKKDKKKKKKKGEKKACSSEEKKSCSTGEQKSCCSSKKADS